MKQFFGNDYPERRIVVKDGDTLNLGKRTLSFIAAPMVHWPEVIVTYDSFDKVLFSADGFGDRGQFGDRLQSLQLERQKPDRKCAAHAFWLWRGGRSVRQHGTRHLCG